MYLSRLSEKQKNLFLELAYQLALIDNDYSEKEKIMIKSYCDEMGMEVPAAVRAASIDEIISAMNSGCTALEKKIIVFEMLGLAMVDGNYDESEREILAEIMRVFEVEEDFARESEKLLDEYIGMQNRMNTLVLGS